MIQVYRQMQLISECMMMRFYVALNAACFAKCGSCFFGTKEGQSKGPRELLF